MTTQRKSCRRIIRDDLLLSLQDKSTPVRKVRAVSPVPPDPQTTPLLDVTEILP